jgi:imidazolonepropionase-like amidohydrolase
VIELGDVTLLPGFIDAHTHLSFEAGENYYRDYFEGLMRHQGEQTLLASTYARKTVEAGVTTVRDLASSEYIDVSLRNGITAGYAVGPRMLVAVHAIGATGGHGDSDAYPPSRGIPQQGPMQGICSGAAECRSAVRSQIKYGADVIKVMMSGGVLSLADSVDLPQMTREEIEAIVVEAHQWGRKVAAHCHGDAAARTAIAAGVDSIEHGTFLQPETLALMRDKGTYLVPTLMAAESVKGRLDQLPQSIATKARAAIRIARYAVPQCAQGGSEDRLRHRLGGLAARSERARVRAHDEPRHGSRRGAPHHCEQRRAPRR